MNKKMNMNKLSLGLLTAFLFVSTVVFSKPGKPAGTLTFNVRGLVDNIGQIVVQLFRKIDDVPSSPFQKVTAEIVNKTAVVKINNLPYGEYAAIILHDQNSDGEVEHCWGVPCEPLGYTNNWELTLFSGMPTFDKLKFTFSVSNDRYNINMKE
jgi:uncharacterized protein (DUF2141 family)